MTRRLKTFKYNIKACLWWGCQLTPHTTYGRNCGSTTVARQQRIILVSLVHIYTYPSIIITHTKRKYKRQRNKCTSEKSLLTWQLKIYSTARGFDDAFTGVKLQGFLTDVQNY